MSSASLNKNISFLSHANGNKVKIKLCYTLITMSDVGIMNVLCHKYAIYYVFTPFYVTNISSFTETVN